MGRPAEKRNVDVTKETEVERNGLEQIRIRLPHGCGVSDLTPVQFQLGACKDLSLVARIRSVTEHRILLQRTIQREKCIHAQFKFIVAIS